MEAKLRQEEIIKERKLRGGRHYKDPQGGSVRDAALKIAKQEKRIQTLDQFFKEQKLIFAANGCEENSFHL